jgi:predicted N-acyltransferase
MKKITVGVRNSAEAIAAEDWARLAPPDDPFVNRDFLGVLERHGAAGRECGWLASHLVASDERGTLVGIMPLYLRLNSHGDFIYDWSWAAAYRQTGRAYYPKLLTGLPHTPATGARILAVDGGERTAIAAALIAAAKALIGEYAASSWHVAFPREEDAEALKSAGLIFSHDVQFHWLAGICREFDDYLAGFTAEKRRKIRAERRRVAESGLAIEVRHGDEVDAREWPALHALYESTFDKFGNYAVLSAQCLAELGVRLGRRMVVFIARDGRIPVAVSLCFKSRDTLYGRYWGTSGSYHSLHFELCFYQGISYCLRTGLRRFEPGAGGEHKLARGFTPTLVQSAHWIADVEMRRLLARYLREQGLAVASYRDDAADHLPFRNAG